MIWLVVGVLLTWACVIPPLALLVGRGCAGEPDDSDGLWGPPGRQSDWSLAA